MLHFTTTHFSDLSLIELYRILQLRQEVFILEQICPYLDCDNKDLNSFHVLGKDDFGIIHAYCRILDAGVSYKEYSSIGRVVTSSEYRKSGEGRNLMNYALKETIRIYPKKNIKISAQCYISHFYESLGFVKVGEEYLEDDIPHIAMIYEVVVN
jgi:ElaA protein